MTVFLEQLKRSGRWSLLSLVIGASRMGSPERAGTGLLKELGLVGQLL